MGRDRIVKWWIQITFSLAENEGVFRFRLIAATVTMVTLLNKVLPEMMTLVARESNAIG